MESRDYIQREINKLSILFKKLLSLLDQDPTGENTKKAIGNELTDNFASNMLELTNEDLIALGKEQNFSIENWEQLLFFMNGYNNKYPKQINDCDKKLLAIYQQLQKEGGTISFETLSIVDGL